MQIPLHNHPIQSIGHLASALGESIMKNLVMCFLICVLLAVSYISCEVDHTNERVEPPIDCSLDPEVLDFGGVVIGEYADLSVEVKLKAEPLDTIDTECDHFSFIDPITGEPSNILFTGNLEYYYSSTSATYDTEVEIRFSPLSTGEKSCNITFSYTGDSFVFLCPLLIAEGVGIDECGFNPAYLDFSPVEIGSSDDLSVTLSVVAWPPDNPTIACDDFRFIDPITLTPTATLDFSSPSFPYDHNQATGVYSTELTFRFAPLTAGTKDCTINIVKTGQDAYDCPTLELHGIAGAASGDWRWFNQVTTYDLKDVYGDDGKVYACGDGGTVIRHTHGEMQFNAWMEEDFDEIPLDAIWVTETGVVWVGGGEVDGGYTYGKTFNNDDGSTNWTEVNWGWLLDMVSSIWGTGQCDQYWGGPAISGMEPTLYHWDCVELTDDDLGFGYEKVTGIHGSGPEDVWAVLDFFEYNAYHYDGVGWALLRETWMDQALYDVWVAFDGQAWAVGANGAIYHWSGIAWTDQSISGETRTIYGVWGFATSDIYAVGADLLFYHYDGSTWEELVISGAPTETFYGVWGLSVPNKYIYAVGTNGTTLRYSP